MSELKPCPFCVSRNISEDCEAWRCRRLECDDCGCVGPASDVIEHDDGLMRWDGITDEEALQQAIDRWNKRLVLLRGEIVELV